MSFLRSLVPISVFAALYAAVTMMVTNPYYQLSLTLVLVWASFGLSWNMLSGYTGLVSFGHGLYFCLGAYAAGTLEMLFGTSDMAVMLLAAMAVSGVVAAALPHQAQQALA